MHEFWKIIPSGNPTLFLRSEEFLPSQRASVAAQVMSPLHIGAEQTAYISFGSPHPASSVPEKFLDSAKNSLPDRLDRNFTFCGLPRMDMMGGEFCLNATRAFAALLATRNLLTKAQESCWEGNISVSGADSPVSVRVIEQQRGLYAEAALVLSSNLKPECLSDTISLVRLPGIAHLIIKTEERCTFPATWQQNARDMRDYYLAEEEAVGCMWLSPSNMLFPAVYVKATDTLCPETACGSGTLASALFRYYSSGQTHMSFRQPSGENLDVRIEEKEKKLQVWVGGYVKIVAHGELEICQNG